MKTALQQPVPRPFPPKFLSFMGSAILPLLVFCTAATSVVATRPACAQDRESSAELSQEEQEIKAVLSDVGGRMRSLAKKLDATQPDDAKRLREAADRIHSSDLNRVLDEITSLIQNANFLEALGRQDRALDELDAIISILEKTKFESREETEKKLSETEKGRLEVAKLAGKQEGLLQKTKELLDRVKALAGLKDLKSDLASLKENQSAINQGADPEKLDPGAAQADEKALERAKDLAHKLLEAQEKVNQRMAGLPGQNLPIPELRELLGRLDQLIAESKDVASKADDANAAERDLKDIASGKSSSAKPSGKPGETPEGAQKGAEGGKDKEPPAGGTPEKGPPEKGSSDKPAPEKSGPSDVEVARRAEAVKDAKAKIDAAAKDLAAKLGKLSSDVARSQSAESGAKENVSQASAKAGEASKRSEKGDLAQAAESEREAATDLKKARDLIAGDLRKMEESNAAQTAGIVQEQGMLEKETSEGSSQMGQDSQQSSSDAARSALEKGSKSVSEAAQSMEKAARAQQDGDRSGAKAAGEKAKADLARAEAELAKGREAVAARNAAEKAADLQKKLARKAQEASKKAEELQKKLGKKENESAGKLGDAQKSISEAASSMQQAGEAGKKGDSSLQKKKGEEAMQRLEKATASLEEEERDELARLEKEKLKKDAPQQEELARLTKEQAKKSARASKGSNDQSQQLDQAAESMDKAGDDMEKEDAESAQKNQEEALAKLKNTEQEMRKEEERLARLKREQEMLSMVEALTSVKDSQEKLNAETAAVDTERGPLGEREQESKRQRIKVQQKVEKLVAKEGDLADQVDSLNVKLKEELARVFTFVLKNTSADMRQIRDSLKELETGSYTQFLEKEVVRDVERLIAALKAELEKPPEQPPQSGQPRETRPRLVPPVAELRMLKDMQLDVNKGTRDLEDLRKASTGKTTESWGKALDRLLQKQGSVSRMTGEILKDFQKAAGPEEESDGKDGTKHEHEEHEKE